MTIFSSLNSASSISGTVSPANGGTGLSSPAAHQLLITEGSSPMNLSGVGTAGQVMQSSGAGVDPAWSTATYPQIAGSSTNILASNGTNFVSTNAATAGASLFLIQSQTANNSASIAFTTGITSTYNTYLLLWSNYTPASTQLLELQISTDGGSSYISTGYVSDLWDTIHNGTGWGNTNVTNCILLCYLPDTTLYSCGQMWLTNVTNGNSIVSYGTCQRANDKGFDLLAGYNSANTINAFQILSASGNITNGTFSLYGVLE